jgi:hypothetical protein
MVRAVQLISTMTHSPPLDQRIVDEYFQLDSQRTTKNVAWLFAMIATYGVKPEELSHFDWGPEGTLLLTGKKRPIRPMHPQWVFLFDLQKKRPHSLWSRLESLTTHLYRLMAHQEISVNITDLILAHRIRKSYYRQIKQKPVASPAYAGVF